MVKQEEVHEDLQTVLAVIHDGFVAVDSEWRCTYVNNKAASLVGRDWHEMIGRSLWELFPDVLGTEADRILRGAMEERKPVEFDHFFRGCERWFQHRAYPSDRGLAIFSVDITQQKENETRLLDTQERLIATYDNAPVGIAETDKNGNYVRVNRKWCEITGYSEREMLTLNFAQVTHPDDIEKDTRQYRKLLNAEINSYDIEKRYFQKNGTLLWVQVHRALVQRPDGTLFCIAVAQNITARKRAEEELSKAQDQLRKHAAELEDKVAERTAELEKSNKAMESFCYSIAHDLRAPVRAMQGLTAALAEDYGQQLDASGKDFTARINKACERMDCMIQDLLVYGELTHIKLPLQEIDLEPMVEAVIAKFTPKIKNSNALVEVVKPLSRVMGDTIVLNQMLSNLISNALTFVAPGVHPHVKIWTEREGATVTISVQDNGIGIAPQYHANIFKLFETLHPMGVYPGTGIGLALVRQGAERLGGKVGVDSKEGEGSRFWVQLRAVKGDLKARS